MANNIFTGALSNNWAVAGNWSLGSIPTASDGHIAILNGSSPNCTLGANRVCNNIDFTGYTGTLTMSTSSITVSGDVTLGAAGGMTITGSGGLVMNTSANLSSAGFVWPNTLGFQGTNRVYTLLSDITLGGALSLNGTTTLTINNDGTPRTIYATSRISSSAAGSRGTAKIIMSGTGAISTTGAIRNNLDFDTAGTITVGGNFRYAGGLLRYISGTMDVTTNNSQFFIGVNGVTTTQIDTSGMTWLNISNPAGTNELVSDLNVMGQYSSSANVTFNSSGGHIRMVQSTPYNIIFGGSQTHQGTAKIIFNGTDCQWVGSTGTVQNSIDIDGTLTITGTCNWRAATMTHISGTVAGTGIIYVTSIATWDTATTTLPNVTITTSVQTINSTFNVGTLTLGLASTVKFAGSFGFNVDHLVNTTTNQTITLKAGNTYTVNQSLLLRGSAAPSSSTNSVTLQSDTTFSYAYFNVLPGAISNCLWVRAIDIDSSGGRELYAVNGLVSRSTNWVRTTPGLFPMFNN